MSGILSGVTGAVTAVILCATAVCALCRQVPLFPTLLEGIQEGLHTLYRILPPIAATLAAVYMFRASGAMDALTGLLAPLLTRLGLPPETAGLMLLRPLSGSGALAVGTELMGTYGPDSYIGRVAAVMLGSTETTFYTISVYFGAAGIRRTRHAVPAALAADLTGFLAAAFFVRLLLGGPG